MAKEQDQNKSHNGNGEDNLADKLLTTITKMDKVDTAFGSRFDELMKFQTILKTQEKKISDLIKTNETKLEKATERLAKSKQDITALDKEIADLKTKSQSHRDFITNGLNRTELDIGEIKREQKGLEASFSTLKKELNELKEGFNKKNQLSKIIIWSYRGAIVVMAIMLLYYHSTLNGQIESLNNKLSDVSKEIIEIKQTQRQASPEKKPPVDNKPKSNKN